MLQGGSVEQLWLVKDTRRSYTECSTVNFFGGQLWLFFPVVHAQH